MLTHIQPNTLFEFHKPQLHSPLGIFWVHPQHRPIERLEADALVALVHDANLAREVDHRAFDEGELLGRAVLPKAPRM